MRKIQNNPSIDKFLTIVTKEFKNVHKETWLTTIDRTGLKSGNYDTNNQTNEYWDILMDRFRDT